MKQILGIELDQNSREELLPDFQADFPYLATRAELDRYAAPIVPWHWHKTAELFYVESGCLEYTTPNGTQIFPAGSGGFLTPNVLHTTRILSRGEPVVQLLHLFDPGFLGGEQNCRIHHRYILPLTSSPAVELIPLSPEVPQQAAILSDICHAFQLSSDDWGYEFALRETLCKIWLSLFALAQPLLECPGRVTRSDESIKAMMVYVHEHFRDPICVNDLAQTVHISKRACFRLFRSNLHMSPLEYIQSFRLQQSAQLLLETDAPITQIALACGFGSSSYFGKLFRSCFGCTPAQYRKTWHDRNSSGHF